MKDLCVNARSSRSYSNLGSLQSQFSICLFVGIMITVPPTYAISRVVMYDRRARKKRLRSAARSYIISWDILPTDLFSRLFSLSVLFLLPPSFLHSVSFRTRFLCPPLSLFAPSKGCPSRARAHRNPVICPTTRKLSTVGRKDADRNRPKL